MRHKWLWFVCIVTLLTIAATIYPACMPKSQSNIIGIPIELRDKILLNNKEGLVRENQAILGQILKNNNIVLEANEVCQLDLSNWKITIKGGSK